MENGYPLAVRTEEYVYPGELRLLSIVAGRENFTGPVCRLGQHDLVCYEWGWTWGLLAQMSRATGSGPGAQ